MIERDVSYKRYDSYKTMMMKKMTKSRKKKKKKTSVRNVLEFSISQFMYTIKYSSLHLKRNKNGFETHL